MINRDIKTKAIHKFLKNINEDFIQYVGIAIDEPKRLERLNGTNKISLLTLIFAACYEQGINLFGRTVKACRLACYA